MNSNSLARILKAKYYPNVSFLEAPIGNNPSYVWRSIRESQSLIRDGLLWRVGDGNDIAIWLDSWLPDVAFPMVTTTFDFNFGVYMVSDLITDGAWNIDLVNRVFNERDRKLILSIPLRRSSSIDLQFWKHDKRGSYSVSSAYKLQTQESDTAVGNKKFWKKLWSIPAAPKIRNFLWRAVSGSLPTRSRLCSRHVPTTEVCPLCNVDCESEACFS
ncbi:hypothetical protein P3X46_026756 [Hevea brasiliensis]|uniref:Reverse transcriptase zinc-binding domain-containing protein n=1 Tax=Hevea brasiliensis TaxID=3981 RepID=A0ABQ9KXN6_HEVBR|nr:hypothetical protein P3X46_026756 [Hevea brasiliensis]